MASWDLMNRGLSFHQPFSAILRECLCLCTFTKGCDVWRTAKVGTVCQLPLAWAALWTQLDSRSQREVNNYRLRAIMTHCLKMQRHTGRVENHYLWTARYFMKPFLFKDFFFFFFFFFIHVFVFGTYLIQQEMTS